MSLIKNIGIGKEVLNPFTYLSYGTLEQVEQGLTNAHLVPTKEMIDRDFYWHLWYNMMGHNAHYTLTVYIGFECHSVYFNIIQNSVFTDKPLLYPYIEYLHSMYTNSILIPRKDYTELVYKRFSI